MLVIPGCCHFQLNCSLWILLFVMKCIWGWSTLPQRQKLCSWFHYVSIDFFSFHSVLPLSDYQENSFNHDHLRNFSFQRVICQAVISRFLLDAFNRSKDASKSRHLQGDSSSSSASFCRHHHHLASCFILSLLLIFSPTIGYHILQILQIPPASCRPPSSSSS